MLIVKQVIRNARKYPIKATRSFKDIGKPGRKAQKTNKNNAFFYTFFTHRIFFATKRKLKFFYLRVRNGKSQ